MRDFSQFGEGTAVETWAAGRVGSWLEVGAYNGVDYSNTRGLMLAGWPGIAVEPAPDMVVSLREAVESFGAEVIEAACVAEHPAPDTVVLRWTPGQPFSSLTQMESRFEPATVAAVSAHDLCERWLGDPRLGSPRFLSLDTEGTTVGLLAVFLGLLGPQLDLVCVEAHTNVQDERAVALAHLEARGFRVVHENAVNVIAARA